MSVLRPPVEIATQSGRHGLSSYSENVMVSAKLNDWIQILTSVGVILSLIFVGLQIQQSREIAIADIYQQRTAILIQQLGFSFPPEVAYESWRKARAGEELSPEDELVIHISIAARIAYWENNHFQYQLGLMPEEQWEASRKAIGGMAKRDPRFLTVWNTERTVVRKSFADEVDLILREEGVD
jgi:hypothetical protein